MSRSRNSRKGSRSSGKRSRSSGLAPRRNVKKNPHTKICSFCAPGALRAASKQVEKRAELKRWAGRRSKSSAVRDMLSAGE